MKIVGGTRPYVILGAFDLWGIFNDYLKKEGQSLYSYQLDQQNEEVILNLLEIPVNE